MNCKECKKPIILGERYSHQSDSYEYAEKGHSLLCFFYDWDYKTLGSSNDKVLKEGKVDTGIFKSDNQMDRDIYAEKNAWGLV